jgi:hypothetical protein
MLLLKITAVKETCLDSDKKVTEDVFIANYYIIFKFICVINTFENIFNTLGNRSIYVYIYKKLLEKQKTLRICTMNRVLGHEGRLSFNTE